MASRQHGGESWRQRRRSRKAKNVNGNQWRAARRTAASLAAAHSAAAGGERNENRNNNGVSKAAKYLISEK
jgi:hypothetical protein